MSRASSQAAARLARSEKRAPTGTLEQPAPQIPVEEQLDPKSVFEQAYGACTAGKFDEAFKLLFPIWMADECVLFERKSLPALLMLSVEGGNTMLHLAASNGSSGGVTNLLRLGASAAQRNASGQSSADVAQAAGHVEIAELLRSHDAIWSGWGIVELSCLLCLYNGSERFDDSEAYLGRLIERDRAKHGIDGPGSLFRRKLPSGLSMLDIARRVSTLEANLLLEAFELPFGLEGEEVEEEAEETESAEEAKAAEEAAMEWPDDGWQPPCAGYMACALCKGKSGAAGRWGAGKALHPSNLRFPLLVCHPCQAKNGLAEDAAGVWVNQTLRVEAHDVELASGAARIAQLVQDRKSVV